MKRKILAVILALASTSLFFLAIFALRLLSKAYPMIVGCCTLGVMFVMLIVVFYIAISDYFDNHRKM